jgi:hypothetical protein
MKVINMHTRNYKTIADTEFPVSRGSTIIWMGFSDEGQLLAFDDEGVLRSLNF